MLNDAEFSTRVAAMVNSLSGSDALRIRLEKAIAEFFVAHPEIERTRWNETVAGVAIFERLTAEKTEATA